MAKCLINNTGNKGANGVMIQILNFFVGNGFTVNQACGIAGNAYCESEFDPTRRNPNDKGKVSFGLFQWRDKRFENSDNGNDLKAYCIRKGYDYRNANAQLNFCWDENYKNFQKYYKEHPNMTATESARWWQQNWEVGSNWEKRKKGTNMAAAIYEQLNKGECVVDTSDGGSSSNQNFSCNVDDGETLASDISIVEDSTVQTTTSQPNGNSSTAGNAKNNTVDTKPLFAGDSWAYKIWHSDEYMKKNWGLLAKAGLSMSNLAKQLKRTLSNKNRRPKYIVIYCSDDTKLSKNTSSIFTTGTTELVKDWCRDILGCCNGIQVCFCTNVMDSLYEPNKSDYYLTAASVLNRALRKLKSEGDSAKFKLIEFDSKFRVDVLLKNSVEIPSDRRMTLNPTGFSKMGPYIRKQIHGGS